ncbi:hypothetical protein [Streptomyces sp. NPDC002580]|uniref:hypothetical protein n=1 Tax=Streptomyces sp. NPDC002580 TaxID=3364653 RepID=UPI0036B7F6C5
MTARRRTRIRLLGPVLAPALLLTACTAAHDSGTRPEASASASPSAHPSSAARGTADQDEARLTARVRTALDAGTGHGSMIESGTERVADGIHTRPTLDTGTAYRLTVVCAGEGEAEIVFTPRGAGSAEPLPCDGSAVLERFTATDPLRVDVRGRPDATGVLAWRIDKA